MTNPSSIAFNSRNPRSNLPPSVRAKQAEVRFQNAFLREWLSLPKETGVGGSQFELPNFGIADTLILATNVVVTGGTNRMIDLSSVGSYEIEQDTTGIRYTITPKINISGVDLMAVLTKS